MSIIQGFGGGKGGGGGGGTEDPNTLRSTQLATVLDALSEGPIKGLANGAQSVFFDKVPLQNASGTYNFNNASFGYTTGDIGSNQHASSAITGDLSNVEATIPVGVQVWQASPIVRSVIQPNVDHIRVTISTPSLVTTDTSNGDVHGTSASFIIELQTNGGGFVQVVSDTFSGKTTSKYSRDYLIPVSGGPWDIRVTRTSADDPNTYTQSQIWFDELTTVISTKLEYRHTAIAGISIDARQFSAVPTRAYDVYGLIINVPSNYDPIARTYTGTWDGTFKLAWSNNPAWVFYDLLINQRYGLGSYIDPTLVNKWELYTISQYCDQLVPDGYGGQEPRFTCNAYITNDQDAYKTMQDLASVFRAIVYWASGAISLVQDAPSDPVQLFTAANVIDGSFQYQGASSKAIHTVCLVTYKDPNNWYENNVEYVQDDEAVAQYGVIKTQINAFGCTSRGQAHRLGRWLLYSEKLESETITFRAGMDAIYCYPGAIIQTSDPNRAGSRMGGRIHSVSSDLKTLTLDAPIPSNVTGALNIQLMLQDGSIYSGLVSSSSNNTITLSNALSTSPVSNAVYLISSANVNPETWRVVSIGEVSDGNIIEISAVSHNPSKYGFIEDGYNLVTPNISSINAIPADPINLSAYLSRYVIDYGIAGYRVTFSWTAIASYFIVSYQKSNGQIVTTTQDQNSIDIDGAQIGDVYTLKVTAVSGVGKTSNPSTLIYTAENPIIVYPADVQSINASYSTNGIRLTWTDILDPNLYNYEIRDGKTWDSGTFLGYFSGSTTIIPFQVSGTHQFWIKARDKIFTESINAVSTTLIVSNPSPPIFNRSNVQENSVAIGWNDSMVNQPISSYAIYTGNQGDTFENSTLFGKAGSDSRSDIVIFKNAGAKTIWLIAKDVAGNLSDPSSVNVDVYLPNNIIVSNDYIENWSYGTITNGFVKDGSIYLPVVDQAWGDHFSSNNFKTLGDQVSAGDNLYFQPTPQSGSYVEVHDCQKILPNGTISVTPVANPISGSINASILIEWSPDNQTWQGITGNNAVAVNFRYVRVTYLVANTSGYDLVSLNQIHIVVSSQTITEFASLVLNPDDVNGTPYTCHQNFTQIKSAIAQAMNSSQIAKINTIISDAVTPQIVYIQAWDVNNNRTNGTVSIQIGGF